MGLNISFCFCTLSSMHQLELGKGDSDSSFQRLLEGNLLDGRRYKPLRLPAKTTLKQESPLLRLPNELLTRILLCVDDYVDRYCLGLSCSRLFAICEQTWLVKYHEEFQRPRLFGAMESIAWNQLPEQCADLFGSLYRRRSALDFKSTFSQDDFDADALLPVQDRTMSVNNIIDAMPMLPQASSESIPDSDPLAAVLRPLGEKVWKRIVDGTVCEPGELTTVFSSADPNTAYAAAINTGIPEAPVLCRSLIFHISTPASPPAALPRNERRNTVLRNHTKKIFVLHEPMRRIFEKCFPQSTNGYSILGLDTVSECILLERILFAPPSKSDSTTSPRGEWVGDELDVISEEDFRAELRSMDTDSLQQWVNKTGEVMETLWGSALDERSDEERNSWIIRDSKAYLNSQLHPGITALALSMLKQDSM